MARTRDLDVVLLGTSGFVGRITAEHLAATAPAGLHVALAGRSREKLSEVRDSLGEAASGWPLLTVDTTDRSAVRDMAENATVVATAVGPYAKYGMPVVEACAAAGTHYADLTGEALFVRDSLSQWSAAASASGARIVHSCGFDSVPSDLSVLLLAQRVEQDGEGSLEDTRLVVRSMSGGISGGTIDSARTMAMAIAAEPSLGRLLADPYVISPDREAEPDVRQPRDSAPVRWSGGLGSWVGPFVMATYNTRVVRFSNALQDWRYGRTFSYGEEMAFGRDPLAPVRAAGVAAGTVAAIGGLAFGPTRTLLDRVLPAPGEGPSEQTRRNGHFTTETRTRTTSGAVYACTITASGDPGYQATSVMLGQSALALALDAGELPDAAGVLTPATGIGAVLADRLRAQGFTIDVERVG